MILEMVSVETWFAQVKKKKKWVGGTRKQKKKLIIYV
jgi:hypothetical protein